MRRSSKQRGIVEPALCCSHSACPVEGVLLRDVSCRRLRFPAFRTTHATEHR
jgi:hypothetical protein